MTIHPNKLGNIQSLNNEARSDYFVRKITDFQELWGLSDAGWATAVTGEVIAIPFWPEEEFAALCTVDEWSAYTPKAISLKDFLSKWLVGMEKDNRVCLIFPTPNDRGVILYPDQLKQLIENELRQYE